MKKILAFFAICSLLIASLTFTALASDVSVSIGGKEVISGTGPVRQASTIAGPFQLIETKTPAADVKGVELLKDTAFQSESDFDKLLPCAPKSGKYINITVTNHNNSTGNLIVNLYYPKTPGEKETIPHFTVGPGKTVTKTVLMDETAMDPSLLGLNVTYDFGGEYKIDANIDVVQFN